MPKFLVRWDSAAPMLETAVKQNPASYTSAVSQWSKDFYVITVTGGMGPRSQEGASGSGDWRPDSSRIQEMQDRIKDATSLTPKGKDPIAPVRVEMLQTPAGRATAFLFPRTAGLSLDDKEVVFQTAMGPMAVKSTFKLKDMTYQGKLQL